MEHLKVTIRRLRTSRTLLVKTTFHFELQRSLKQSPAPRMPHPRNSTPQWSHDFCGAQFPGRIDRNNLRKGVIRVLQGWSP